MFLLIYEFDSIGYQTNAVKFINIILKTQYHFQKLPPHFGKIAIFAFEIQRAGIM
jgi:hypothetical protein